MIIVREACDNVTIEGSASIFFGHIQHICTGCVAGSQLFRLHSHTPSPWPRWHAIDAIPLINEYLINDAILVRI